ncbi:MAG: Crp/Fnr family transcriptional regulator [Bacillota bacterium]|nr:Crp/Fnr family transcriptional regulator [Bacillota bacterium]
MEERIAQLQTLPFWADLTNVEREEIIHGSAIQQFPAGSMIHNCVGECLGLFLVRKGGVRVYLLSEEGREVTLFQMGEGDICTLSASCVLDPIEFDTQMTALEDCQLLVVNAGVIRRIMEENLHVRCFIYEMTNRRFTDVMRSMQQLLFFGVDQRLAVFLLKASEKADSPEIRITHEQIAQQISSAREVVARMLKKFSNQGLVEVRRGSVRLLDRAGLEALI